MQIPNIVSETLTRPAEKHTADVSTNLNWSTTEGVRVHQNRHALVGNMVPRIYIFWTYGYS